MAFFDNASKLFSTLSTQIHRLNLQALSFILNFLFKFFLFKTFKMFFFEIASFQDLDSLDAGLFSGRKESKTSKTAAMPEKVAPVGKFWKYMYKKSINFRWFS